MIIGDSNILNDSYSVWTNSKPYSSLRQSERLLLSRLDLLTSYKKMTEEGDPNSRTLDNLLSLYYIEFMLVDEFGCNPDYLYKAGVSMTQYINHIMACSYSSDKDRNAFILSVLHDIKKDVINGSPSLDSIPFMNDWVKEVYNQNYFIDFNTGGISENTPSASIGDSISENLQNDFKKVAGNLVYSVVPYSTITTAEAKRKRVLQNAVISALCGSGYGFTDAICNNLIRSSIVSRSQLSPEAYVECMKELGKQRSSKIGDFGILELVAAVVTALITAGVAVFTAIYNARRNSSYRDAVSALGQAGGSYADIPDWLSLGDLDGDGTDDTLKVYGALIAVGALAYYYHKR